MATTITLDVAEVQDLYFDRGWTDGLPIVPPTLDRVSAMLEAGGVEPGDVIGAIPERNRELTAELAAVNAVMAGCRPEYFRFVIAGLQAMLAPQFNANAVIASTGGAALCTVVSGPGTSVVGMNGGTNALGSGNRANATIGRALRLVAANVFDAKTGRMDMSSLGHPGKYSFCFAEETPPDGWTPLRVDLGFDADDTTVTVFASEGPHQVSNHHSEDPDELCRTFAAVARMPATAAVGKGMQAIAVIGSEHRQAMAAAGLSKEDVRRRIVDASRIHPDELTAAGVHPAPDHRKPGEDGRLPTFVESEHLLIVTAGGGGAGFSAYIPPWSKYGSSTITTRRVRDAGEPLTHCGPRGSAMPAEAFTRLPGKDPT